MDPDSSPARASRWTADSWIWGPTTPWSRSTRTSSNRAGRLASPAEAPPHPRGSMTTGGPPQGCDGRSAITSADLRGRHAVDAARPVLLEPAGHVSPHLEPDATRIGLSVVRVQVRDRTVERQRVAGSQRVRVVPQPEGQLTLDEVGELGAVVAHQAPVGRGRAPWRIGDKLSVDQVVQRRRESLPEDPVGHLECLPSSGREDRPWTILGRRVDGDVGQPRSRPVDYDWGDGGFAIQGRRGVGAKELVQGDA